MNMRQRKRRHSARFWWQSAAGLPRPYDWSNQPRKRYGRSNLTAWYRQLSVRYVF